MKVFKFKLKFKSNQNIARLLINAVVEALHKDGAVRLRCDVTIDRIQRFEIQTTSRRIYLDDAPQEFAIRALTDDGDTFSSIAGSTIFQISKKNSRNIIRLGDAVAESRPHADDPHSDLHCEQL